MGKCDCGARLGAAHATSCPAWVFTGTCPECFLPFGRHADGCKVTRGTLVEFSEDSFLIPEGLCGISGCVFVADHPTAGFSRGASLHSWEIE